jgi:DNA-binding transcriptional MerR regulator
VPTDKLPDKLFFKIGEVAKIVGVQTHVLRYWESELPALRPMKTRGAHRMYRRKDVELAVHVKRLLHEDGLTMSGAKRKLRELRREAAESGESGATEAVQASAQASVQVSERAELLVLRKELGELLKALDKLLAPEPRPRDERSSSMVVTSAVSSTVPIGGRRGV